MSPTPRHLNLEIPRSRERFGGGVALAAIVHGGFIAAIVLAAISSHEVLRSIGGPGPRGGGGGGGGSVVRYVDLPAVLTAGAAIAQAVEAPAVELQLPEPDVARVATAAPRVELRQVTGPLVAGLRVGSGSGTGGGPGAGTGTGGGVGSGQGTGVGSGEGPGSGGEGGSILPPEPKFIIVPADRPRSVRGREYEVHFWVDTRGRVTKVEVDPQIEDRDYRRRFLDQMYQFQFTPARTLDGQPVEGHIVIPITL